MSKTNAVVIKVDQDYHYRRLWWGLERRLRCRAQLLGEERQCPGVVDAFGKMSDGVYVIAEAVAEELATEL